MREAFARCILGVILCPAVLLACTGDPPPPPPNLPVVAYLAPVSAEYLLESGFPAQSPTLDAFRRGMEELGYRDGQNIKMEYRFVTEAQAQDLPRIAADLVSLEPDVIVAIGEARVRAVMQATDTIPIVMAAVTDPVENGLIQSLAAPGGNVTGMAILSAGLEAKRLQMLAQAVPRTQRVGVLVTPGWDQPDSRRGKRWAEILEAALGNNIEVFPVEVRPESTDVATTAAVESAIAAAAERGAHALFPLPDFVFDVRRDQLAAAARDDRLASIYSRAEFARAGGLISYGPDTLESFQRVAEYVRRLLDGAQPGDLPVQQPSRYELVLNLSTARDLSITFSTAILDQATELVD